MRYLIIVLSLLTINATAQNFNETIDYINDILKVNHDWLGTTTGIMGADEKLAENPSYFFTKITLDTHGKIEVRVYKMDAVTERFLSNGPPCYGYLKSLNVTKGEDFISDQIGKSLYKVVLLCPASSGGSFICTNGTDDRLAFLINDEHARDRLLNAFSHLLELAKANMEFYNKDPFSN